MSENHKHGGKTSEKFIDKGAVLRGLQIPPGSTVLDAGCGNGYMAKEFAKIVGRSGKVYAFDVHQSSLEALASEKSDAEIFAAAEDIAGETSLEDESVDVVYLSLVYHGFTEAQRAGFICEMNRILRSGGKLAIVEFDTVENGFGPPAEIRYSPEELLEAVELKPLKLLRLSDYLYMQIFSK